MRTGKLGADVNPEEGKTLARICALNALAAVDSLVDLDAVTRVVKVVGFVASAPGFHGQPSVINGASICWPRCSAIAARMRVRRSAYPSYRWMRRWKSS